MKRSTLIVIISILITVQLFAGGGNELDTDGWLVYSRLSNFDSVDVRINAEISLYQGTEWEVKARGTSKDLDDLDLYVSGKNLIIRQQSVFNFLGASDRVEISITVPMLENIKLSSDGSIRTVEPFECTRLELSLDGSGRMSIEAIADRLEIDSAGSGEVDFRGRADTLRYRGSGSGNADIDILVNRTDIKVSGSGRVEMTGETDLMLIDNTGSGSIYADRLTAQSVEVNITGSGNVTVTANQEIEANILGSGSLRYYGDPESTVFSILGSGKIRKN